MQSFTSVPEQQLYLAEVHHKLSSIEEKIPKHLQQARIFTVVQKFFESNWDEVIFYIKLQPH